MKCSELKCRPGARQDPDVRLRNPDVRSLSTDVRYHNYAATHWIIVSLNLVVGIVVYALLYDTYALIQGRSITQGTLTADYAN